MDCHYSTVQARPKSCYFRPPASIVKVRYHYENLKRSTSCNNLSQQKSNVISSERIYFPQQCKKAEKAICFKPCDDPSPPQPPPPSHAPHKYTYVCCHGRNRSTSPTTHHSLNLSSPPNSRHIFSSTSTSLINLDAQPKPKKSILKKSQISVSQISLNMDNQNENICPTVRFQYKQAPIPAYWCLQPNTACINDNYNLIDLIEGSEEYDLIKADFMRTMNFGYINPKVFHAQRIENYKLYNKYFTKKNEFCEERGLPNEGNELMLYHGTKAICVKEICKYGFDLECSRPECRVLGRGVYFSRFSGNSHIYTDFMGGQIKFMFLARVLLGDLGQGYTNWNEDQRPRKDTGKLYDSTKDLNDHNYCVFSNEQCYPEYLIIYC